ncbi:MAG TPA: SDR family oxidoreductase [Planctomycetota bacterium]|nr:SDR family oxidoreductase [Planctomycetota bacterium]
MQAVVTGANRGIGLEMTRQLVARGCFVFAGVRAPNNATVLRQLAKDSGKVKILHLDVANPASIEVFAREVLSETPALQILVNNAGILPDENSLDDVSAEKMIECFRVNSVAPVLMVQKLRPVLEKGKAKILNVSSGTASMQNASKIGRGLYSYCASKSALNRLGLCLAAELRNSGVSVFSFEPGWVKTDMAKGGGDYTPQEAVSNVLKIFDRLTLEESGGYYNWKGDKHPW